MNLLLVDDEIMMLRMLKKAIDWKLIGIDQVFTALNVEEAKRIFEEQSIDIAVCDIEMPRENGLVLIEWLQYLYPETINIILTGHADFNYARSAVSLGVYEYLLKPATYENIQEVIGRAVQRKLDERKKISEKEINSEERGVLERIKHYIRSHYNEIITRNDIEKLVNMNSDYINRRFKQETGYTLMEYIQVYRVQKAKEMLLENRMTIAEIGTEVGYDSPAYFSKIFKKVTGQTPNEFRQ